MPPKRTSSAKARSSSGCAYSPILWVTLAALFAIGAVLLFLLPNAKDSITKYMPSGGPADYSKLAPPSLRPTLTNVFPHDSNAFTQGLIVEGATMWESTGLYGQSSLRRVELGTGKVLDKKNLEGVFFAEGLTAFKGKLYQLTWRERVVFVYNQATLERERIVKVPYEGWGLTHDGESLILSDGSNTLYWLDPETLQERRKVSVLDASASPPTAVTYLNELEYIDGAILANVWMTDRIAVIDAASGFVRAHLDIGYINPKHERPPNPDAVLNGIAWEPEQRRLFVTGKLWPLMYELVLPKLP